MMQGMFVKRPTYEVIDTNSPTKNEIKALITQCESREKTIDEIAHLFPLSTGNDRFDDRANTYFSAYRQKKPNELRELASFYEKGKTPVPQSKKKAFQMMHQAALKSDRCAMYSLARYYEKGVGCKTSFVNAKSWYLKSYLNGLKKAKKDARRCDELMARSGSASSFRYGAARHI